MVRLVEWATAHWPTPSKSLEKDVSGAARDRYVEGFRQRAGVTENTGMEV